MKCPCRKMSLPLQSQHFPKPYEPFGGEISVKVDLSNYPTKAYLKNETEVDTSKLAAKSDLASLKVEVQKLDIDKLIIVPVDFSKLSDAVKNDAVKKTVNDKLVAKVSNIDTSGFVLKTKYDTDKSELEKKIPDTSGLVKKTDYNAKITEIKNKIPSVSCLASNKIPDVSSLVKKKKIMTRKLVKLKRHLQIIIMINILLLQNLTSLTILIQQVFGNLNNCLMKGLIVLLHLITVLLQN